MCLSIAAEVIKVDDESALVNINGNIFSAPLILVDNLHVGDYVLIHSGYILEKINKKQAEENIKIIIEAKEKAENEIIK